MITPFVFGVDLDGVVADYTLGFRDVVAAARGVEPDTLPIERSWDFEEWDFGPDDFEEFHRIAVQDHRILASLPMYEGAADALWRLSDAGMWIRIITHRVYVNWGHATAIGDTISWLDSNRIPYRDICFLGAKPQVEAQCYIDDAPHNIDALRVTGNTVIIFDQPYNRHIDGLRARSWLEVEEIVTELAADLGHAVQEQMPGFDSGADRLHRRMGGDS
ncbi:MAG: 5' nucleotidase, NT5C type [Microthrixaceae bacterium]